MNRYLLAFIYVCLLVIVLPVSAQSQQRLVNSPHNMSISGPGAYKSLTTTQVCVFCHAPHSALPDAPLWNRIDSGQIYKQYSSSTLMSVPGQPAGSSRLCLACHDGTIALEKMARRPSQSRGSISNQRIEGRSSLGIDLGNDHPISIIYDAALAATNNQLVHPSDMPLPLENNIVRCGSCHDPHEMTFDPFLRMSSQKGELCVTCHELSNSNWRWDISAHATSPATARGAKPWRERKQQWKGHTVAENACFNCHTPHNALTPARLITDLEEATCFRCHDGGVAKSDIQSDLLKPSRHPVDVTPNYDHDATRVEDPLRMNLHVECADCHNSHGTRADVPMITVNPNQAGDGFDHKRAPSANGLINGVTGIDSSGFVKPEIDMQYEVCFKCHGVPGKSACGNSRCSTARSMDHNRVDGTYNIRDKVDPTANPGLVSYHPIVQNNPFNNNDVPSLRRELGLDTSSTLIYCTDCHNSEQSSAGAKSGAEGPHGSIYPPILSNRYTLSTKYIGLNSASTEAALCFKCHDQSILENNPNSNGFNHSSHQEKGTCITCHDPHGSTEFKHLLNFETRNNLVPPGDSPNMTGTGVYSLPTWIETADGGECWLRCHTGGDHLGSSYPSEMSGFENSSLQDKRFLKPPRPQK